MSAIIAGLDLGQSADYSALAVLERSLIPDRARPDLPGAMVNRFDLRHLHRWPHGTPYTKIRDDLVDWFKTPQLREGTLVIDKTGIGVGVVDMITESGILATLHPVSIQGGQKEGDGTVPKKDLIFAAVAALQTRRLRFAKNMKFVDVLEKELENFRVKVTEHRNETFSAWRENDNDDLCLALSLAVWYGEKTGNSGHWTTAEEGPLDSLPPGTFGDTNPPDVFR